MIWYTNRTSIWHTGMQSACAEWGEHNTNRTIHEKRTRYGHHWEDINFLNDFNSPNFARLFAKWKFGQGVSPTCAIIWRAKSPYFHRIRVFCNKIYPERNSHTKTTHGQQLVSRLENAPGRALKGLFQPRVVQCRRAHILNGGKPIRFIEGRFG